MFQSNILHPSSALTNQPSKKPLRNRQQRLSFNQLLQKDRTRHCFQLQFYIMLFLEVERLLVLCYIPASYCNLQIWLFSLLVSATCRFSYCSLSFSLLQICTTHFGLICHLQLYNLALQGNCYCSCKSVLCCSHACVSVLWFCWINFSLVPLYDSFRYVRLLNQMHPVWWLTVIQHRKKKFKSSVHLLSGATFKT